MTKKVLFVAVLALLVVAVGAWTVEAKSYTPKTEKAKRIEAMEQYKFLFNKRYETPRESADQGTRGGMTPPPASLGTRTSASPGVVAGFTYYDVQRNAAVGRQIDWRADPKIHMTWMFLPTNDVNSARAMFYNIFDPENDNWPLGFGVGTGIPDATNRTGFGGLDVYYKQIGGGLTSNAIVTAHTTRAATGLKTETYYQDFGFAADDFGSSSRITAADQNPYVAIDDLIWPIVEFHAFGIDSVTHVACMGSFDDDTTGGNLVVFSKVGNGVAGAWTSFSPGFVTSQNYSLTASRVSEKVAVVYLQDVSGNDSENDVVYNESTDMGATWGSQVNITNYSDAENGYRAWIETSSLYDTNDMLHIVWNGSEFIVGEGAGSRECRLFHWTEVTGLTTTIYNGVWGDLFGLQECIGGSNVLNASKFSISQCDTNLYVIWQQVNDPPNGLFDDCASDASSNLLWNGNHELYLSVSVGLDGVGWDAPRNLTTSYTPECDSTGLTGDCDNDVMATMSRYGMDNADFPGISFTNASQALTVDPSGGAYGGTHYLDVFYENDQFPGTAVYGDQGPFTQNDMKWFRLPCVDPVVQAELFLSQTSIGYPEYVMHGQDTTITLVLENGGNTTLNISNINITETTGPAGWLSVSASSFNIPCCINPLDSVDVTINTAGAVNSPGTIVALNGTLDFVSNDPNSPTTFEIVDFLVADTVVGAVWETLSTSCIALAVGNNGNMGNAGIGDANMNFAADCDDTTAIPGDETVYLYDGSPLVLKVSGSDTLASWSIFADGFATPNGFKPIESDPAPGTFTGDNYEATYSGKFVTADSSLTIEKAVYFPTAVDSCNFLVQVMCIYATDGSAQNGLAIGEAWDWDIPSDTTVRNSAGSDPFAGVVWLRGGEWNETVGDSLECQNNDARFGGAGLIGWADNTSGANIGATPDNFYTALNSDFVVPAGGFLPGELYENMQTNSGISAVPSSTIEDQHMVMTVFKDYDLAAGDTLHVYMAMGVVENGNDADMVAAIEDARAWYADNAPLGCRPPVNEGCCTGLTGDVNNSGDPATLTDLTLLVNRLFVTFIEVPCPAEANTSGDAGCAITLTDLTLLVNRLFVTFVPTADCATFDQSNCPPAP